MKTDGLLSVSVVETKYHDSKTVLANSDLWGRSCCTLKPVLLPYPTLLATVRSVPLRWDSIDCSVNDVTLHRRVRASASKRSPWQNHLNSSFANTFVGLYTWVTWQRNWSSRERSYNIAQWFLNSVRRGRPVCAGVSNHNCHSRFLTRCCFNIWGHVLMDYLPFSPCLKWLCMSVKLQCSYYAIMQTIA